MSASNDINVLQGNFTEDFFKKDFHADNTIASIFKSKSTEAGALKFTWVKILNIQRFFPLLLVLTNLERQAWLLSI
jgi:hypothetical protein